MNPQTPFQPQPGQPQQPGLGPVPQYPQQQIQNQQPPILEHTSPSFQGQYQQSGVAPQPQYQPQQPSYQPQPPQSSPNPEQNYASYTSQLQQERFAEPYQRANPTSQPAIDYGNEPSAQQRDQYSIDYLNKIAPVEQKKVNKFAVIALIGAVLASALFAVILLMNSRGPDSSTLMTSVSARIQTMHTVTDAQQSHISAPTISETNAAFSSALNSMDAELQTMMKARKIKVDKKKLTATEKPYADALSKKLDDAYQRGTLDRTYIAQMTYEITVLRSKILQLQKTSSSTSVKTFCENSLKNIDIVLKSLSSADSTKT